MFDSILQPNAANLFKGPRSLLEESHVPEHLPHRERQIEAIAVHLAPALRGDLPGNLIVYGKIGTGKTNVVTQVRREIERRRTEAKPVGFVSINCANVDSPYSLLQAIGNEFATKEVDRIPTGWALDRVQTSMRRLLDARGGVVVVILDEIDRLVAHSGDSVLYTLSQVNTELAKARLAIVGISNDLKFTNALDARVRSRLSEEKIVFDPYTAQQLGDILTERAQAAFADGVVDPGVVVLCAAYAALENGDARRAIGLLRKAAEIAERDRARRITQDHVIKAKNRLEQDIIADCCRSLPVHCKILFYVILQHYERRRQSILTGDAYDGYCKLAQRGGFNPLTARSISNHLLELETLGLIKATIVSRGRGGRPREIFPDVPVSEALRALEEDPLIAPFSRSRSAGQMLLTNFDNPARGGPY